MLRFLNAIDVRLAKSCVNVSSDLNCRSSSVTGSAVIAGNVTPPVVFVAAEAVFTTVVLTVGAVDVAVK